MRKYNKKLMVLVLFITINIANAGNLYMGVQGGWEKLTMEGNLSLLPQPHNFNLIVPYNSKSNSGMVDFYIGLQKQVSKRILIAEEWDILVPLARTTAEHYGTVSDQKFSYNLGVSLKSGFYYNKNGNVYARGGLGLGSFEGGIVKQGDATGIFPTVKGDKIFYYRVGLGVNQKISSHWSLQLEYDYYKYSPFSLSQVVGWLTVVTKINPSMNVLMGGLTYIFN